MLIEAHMARITRLLVLPWGVETVTAIALVMLTTGAERSLALLGLGLLVAVVLVTGLLAAPIHGRLVAHFDAGLHDRLLRVDLIRTVLWTGRGAVALLLVL